MVTRRFREQYVDALTLYLHEQELAGLDILTDGRHQLIQRLTEFLEQVG